MAALGRTKLGSQKCHKKTPWDSEILEQQRRDNVKAREILGVVLPVLVTTCAS